MDIPNNEDIPSTNIINTDISTNNGLMADINTIKNNAKDIISKKEEENKVSIKDLMASDKPEGKFFVDLNMPVDNSGILPFKIQSALDSINRRLEEIKMQGISIKREEKDLGTAYQIVITIDK